MRPQQQGQQTQNQTFAQQFQFVSWCMQFPALSVMVFLRQDIGYRQVSPLRLCGVAAFLALLSGAGTKATRPDDLIVFALLVLTLGLRQRYVRWQEIRRGVLQHSLYVGTSLFSFLPLPQYLLEYRRANRYLDPTLCAIIGWMLLRYSHMLAYWLIFSGACLAAFEFVIFRKEFNRELDTADGLVNSEIQSGVVEHFEPSPNASQQQPTAGIPTGLGGDIEAHMNRRRPKP